MSNKLSKLLRKDTKWNTGDPLPPESEEAFVQLKTILLNAPSLANPNFDLPFTLTTDIAKGNEDTKGSLVAVVTQNINAKRMPVGFWSRSLSQKEENLPSVVLERHCIIKAYKFFFHILYGKKIIVECDCKPVVDLSRKYTEMYNYLTDMVSQTKVELHHVPGKKIVSDLLSRYQKKRTKAELESQLASKTVSMVKTIETVTSPEKSQLEDLDIQQTISQ